MSSNPLWSIWLHPRATIRRLVDSSPAWHVIVLACLTGVAKALDRASTRNAGDEFSLGTIAGMCILGGPLLGLASVWILGALLRVFGRWRRRPASSQHLRLVVAWANAPTVLGLVLWIPLLGLAGQEMFSEWMPTLDAHPLVAIIVALTGIVQIALMIWSAFILCHGIAEVQGLRSAWMGLVHVLGAIALIAVPMLLVVGSVFLWQHRH